MKLLLSEHWVGIWHQIMLGPDLVGFQNSLQKQLLDCQVLSAGLKTDLHLNLHQQVPIVHSLHDLSVCEIFVGSFGFSEVSEGVTQSVKGLELENQELNEYLH